MNEILLSYAGACGFFYKEELIVNAVMQTKVKYLTSYYCNNWDQLLNCGSWITQFVVAVFCSNFCAVYMNVRLESVDIHNVINRITFCFKKVPHPTKRNNHSCPEVYLFDTSFSVVVFFTTECRALSSRKERELLLYLLQLPPVGHGTTHNSGLGLTQ